MNSLEFIKQHVTEWPGDHAEQVILCTNGTIVFSGRTSPTPCHTVDLSEHFAPDYYDGKVWTREEFEAIEYRYNNSLANPLLKYENGEHYYYIADGGHWHKYQSMVNSQWSYGDHITPSQVDEIVKSNDTQREAPTAPALFVPDWNDAPDWAVCYGFIGSHNKEVWYDSKRYEYVHERGEEFRFDHKGAYSGYDVKHASDRPSVVPTTVTGIDATVEERVVSSNKYERELTDRQGNSATIDVYDVLQAFNVTCPATQHAVKKLLCTGIRGHKDTTTDLIEARESITRAIELQG